jgi:predicted house-cleaning NTP pyrophosphatase (Maf/HAM1 superfamily)
LRSRRQRKNETIQDLAGSIKELTRKSFPRATHLTVEQEAITLFLQDLEDSELRFYVQQSRPGTLQRAVLMTLQSLLFLQERRKSLSSVVVLEMTTTIRHLSTLELTV